MNASPADSEDCTRLDDAWNTADRKTGERVNYWPQAVFYAASFILTLGWTSMDIWVGKCGMPAVTQFSISVGFGGVALLMGVWAGFSHRDWSGAFRFFLCGLVPVLFPFIILAVLGAD